MTVSSETSKNTYAGTGSQTAFAFTFKILDEDHLLVEVKDVNGVITTQTIVTDYTVSGTGNDTGRTNYTSGNVNFLVAPLATDTVIITRNVPNTQLTDYVENDTFPAETHEEGLDKLTMISQELEEKLDRTVKLDAAVTGFNATLPTPASDKFLKYNAAADAFEVVTLSTTAGLGNIVEDTSPQLGGDLDTNGNNINVGAGDVITFEGATADDFETTLTVVDPTADRTWTIPDASDTAVGKATTDTLTNKTFDANGTGNSLSNVDVEDLANGTDGELITWDAAGAPATVPVGTATHVLTSNGAGAAPTFQAIPDVDFKLLQQKITTSTSSGSTTTTIPVDNTIPQNTEGSEFFTVSITPVSSTSKVRVEVFIPLTEGPNSAYWTGALFEGSTADALATASQVNFAAAGSGFHSFFYLSFEDSPAGSARTYKFRYGPSSGTAYINRNGSGDLFGASTVASITATEIEV